MVEPEDLSSVAASWVGSNLHLVCRDAVGGTGDAVGVSRSVRPGMAVGRDLASEPLKIDISPCSVLV